MIKLAPRKARWAKLFQPKVLRSTPLNPNMAVAARYERHLRWLIDRMIEETERRLTLLYREPHSQEYFAHDASVSSQARILMNELQKKFENLFNLNAKPLAESFTDDSEAASAVSLKSSLCELSGGITLKTDIFTNELKDVLTATIAENVGLIKSIPAQYLDGVQGAVYRSITTGNGLADLIPFLKKHKKMTQKRADLIAHDQTRKAYGAINRIRMQKLGIKKFEWLHSSGGQHPRKLHQQLSGKIFNFDDPPIIDDRTGERGFPGQLINCRCRSIAVIDFGDDE